MARALVGVFVLAGDMSFCLAGDRTCGARMPLARDLVGVSLRLDGVRALLLVAIPDDRSFTRPGDLLESEAADWTAEVAELRFGRASATVFAPFVLSCFCAAAVGSDAFAS